MTDNKHEPEEPEEDPVPDGMVEMCTESGDVIRVPEGSVWYWKERNASLVHPSRKKG